MKTILRQCFSLINPSLSSTYTNEGGVSILFVEIPQKSKFVKPSRYTFGDNGGV